MAKLCKTYKFRLYPTKKQVRMLENQFELCRWVYNESLALKKKLWEDHKINLSLYDLNKKLTEWKESKLELKQVHSQVLQKVQERIDWAYQGFFRRIKAGQKPGFPRFKGKNQLKSICFKQSGFKLTTDNKRINISKIGLIKLKLHREIKDKIKTCSIIRQPTGKFFVCISVEETVSPLPKVNKIVGCDLGIKTLVTLSDGKSIANPKFLKTEEKQLKKAQSQKDKAKNIADCKTFNKKKKVVARINERIVNKRENFAFQTANQLIKTYDTICFENLNIDEMNSFAPINKSIRDVAWRSLIQKTQSKAAQAGKTVVLIKPCNTSRECSRCNKIHENFDIKQEFMDCPCGNHMHRDKNASINILRRGLASLVNAS